MSVYKMNLIEFKNNFYCNVIHRKQTITIQKTSFLMTLMFNLPFEGKSRKSPILEEINCIFMKRRIRVNNILYRGSLQRKSCLSEIIYNHIEAQEKDFDKEI